MKNSLFIDSWGWIVLANRGEPSFPAVSEFYQHEASSDCRIITSDYVLDEVITFLFAKSPANLASQYLKRIFLSIEMGRIKLERIGPDRFEKAWKMRLKFQNRPKISFTDFTSFALMQELTIKKVLTNDRHFEEVNLGFERIAGEIL